MFIRVHLWFSALLLPVALAATAAPATVVAQAPGFPPWPILYQGEVFVSGELWAEPASLSVRIGDWQSERVPVVGGAFRCADPCLIAGPPDFAYIDQPVTFHLQTAAAEAAGCGEGSSCLQSTYTFPFPRLDEPRSLFVLLHFPAAPAEPGSGGAGAQGSKGDMGVTADPGLDPGESRPVLSLGEGTPSMTSAEEPVGGGGILEGVLQVGLIAVAAVVVVVAGGAALVVRVRRSSRR